MTARGGTNINDALLASMDMFNSAERPRMVVFLTDGEPTVGHTDLKGIVGNIDRANSGRTRIFVFGVGNDVNTHLLDSIAEKNRGLSEYVAPGVNIELSVSSFFRKVSEPILADIRLDFGKLSVEEIYPVSLPDIFRGTQLILLGRYGGRGGSGSSRDSGTEAIALTGSVNSEEVRLIYEGNFPARNRDNDFIPRLWATRKIGYLIGQIRLNGESRELVDEIIWMSREYGIMTPYTSFLVLENESDYDEWGLEPSPELMSSGMEYKRAMESEKGEDAVMSARDIGAMKATGTAAEPVLETIKHVGYKTFYLRDGFWVDSAFEDRMRVREIRYLSGSYFKLLEKNPELGRYFALGGNVIVVFESACYRVAD
jgi:Ca-activated chloride channel family protein